MVGDFQANGFAFFDHLRADLDFLFIVSHQNSHGLKIGAYFAIRANMRMTYLFENSWFFSA